MPKPSGGNRLLVDPWAGNPQVGLLTAPDAVAHIRHDVERARTVRAEIDIDHLELVNPLLERYTPRAEAMQPRRGVPERRGLLPLRPCPVRRQRVTQVDLQFIARNRIGVHKLA